MLKIYLVGSFMNDNFGDFLLYDVIVRALYQKYGEDVYVMSSDISSFYDSYSTVHREKHSVALRKADLVIFAGGGYFGEGVPKLVPNLQFMQYYGIKARQVCKSGKPYAILGVGAGPLSFEFSRRVTRQVFNHARQISVRDVESKNFLMEIGVKQNIEVHADWIAGTELQEKQDTAQQTGKKKFLIHLITSPEDRQQHVATAVSDIRRFLQTHQEIQVYITSDQSKGDVYERTRQLYQELDEFQPKYHEYQSPWELIDFISTMDFIVTDKLHLGIVGMNLGIPVVSVPNHMKTLRLYKQAGRERFCRPLRDLAAGQLEEMLNESCQEQRLELAAWKADSRQNRQLLFDFVDFYHNKQEQ